MRMRLAGPQGTNDMPSTYSHLMSISGFYYRPLLRIERYPIHTTAKYEYWFGKISKRGPPPETCHECTNSHT